MIRSDRTKSYHFFSLRTSARVTVVFRKHLYISTFKTLVEKCLGEILPAGSFHVEFLAKQRAPADSFVKDKQTNEGMLLARFYARFGIVRHSLKF